MKKFLSLLSLILTLVLIFCSCDTNKNNSTDTSPESTPAETTSSTVAVTETTSSTVAVTEGTTSSRETTFGFETPADEKAETRIYTATSDDGIKIEITVNGFSSKILGKEFYLKNNEYIEINIKVTNGSDKAVYQLLSTACHGLTPEHHHELEIKLTTDSGETLTDINTGFAHPEMIQLWSLASGESCDFTVKLAAGAVTSDPEKFDMAVVGKEETLGIALYGIDAYTDDGMSIYSGSIGFSYSGKNDGLSTQNSEKVSADLALTVLYFGK